MHRRVNISAPAREARILVRYNTSEVSALADVEIEGVALTEDLSSSLSGLVLYSTRGKSEEEAITALSALPGVLYAEPDYIVSIDRTRMILNSGGSGGLQIPVRSTGRIPLPERPVQMETCSMPGI